MYGENVLLKKIKADFIVRMKKKREAEIEKLAFEMAKYRCNDEDDTYNRKSIKIRVLNYSHTVEIARQQNLSKYEVCIAILSM